MKNFGKKRRKQASKETGRKQANKHAKHKQTNKHARTQHTRKLSTVVQSLFFTNLNGTGESLGDVKGELIGDDVGTGVLYGLRMNDFMLSLS